MKSKPTVRTSVTLATAVILAQLVTSNVAQADSPREWGYWDAATAAGPADGGNDGFSNMTTSQNINGAESNNTGDQHNTEQNTTRLNRGGLQTAKAAAKSDFIGYTICYYSCDGGSGYYNAKTAGTVNVDVAQGEERVASRTRYEHLPNYSNGKPYYVQEARYYDANVAATGTYNGEAFNLNDSAATITNQSVTYFNGHGYATSSAQGQTGNSDINLTLNNNNVVNSGGIHFGSSYGQVLWGKPIAAKQITAQLRLGQTYHFKGNSYYGSSVQVAVDFQNASWNGTWSAARTNPHNGFKAAGNISGNTLSSTNVKGAGVAGVGFVTGGKVNATLVGAINGADASKAAVIGKTVVTVQQNIGTKTVGEVFNASTSGLCKGPCSKI